MTGYYADPTAWEAIANIDKGCHKRTAHFNLLSNNGTDGTHRHNVGVYHAPEAKLQEKKVRLIRPENGSIFTMLRRELK